MSFSKKYGRILESYDCSKLIEKMKTTPLPNNVVYEPSIKDLENLNFAQEPKNKRIWRITNSNRIL